MDETPPAGDPGAARPPTTPADTVAAALARSAETQRRCELGAERLRILSERLAVPSRLARDCWYKAWRCVADAAAAGDEEYAAQALDLAGKTFAAIDAIAAGWLSAARDWVARAASEFAGFANTTVVGLDEWGSFGGWASPSVVDVPDWLADKAEFSPWALALDRVGSLRALPARVRTHPFAGEGETRFCVEVLELVSQGASADLFRTYLAIPGNCGRLAGMGAVFAVCVVPPATDYEFRDVDLPVGSYQRSLAQRFLGLVGGAYGGCAHVEDFRRRYTTSPAETTTVGLLPTPLEVAAASDGAGQDLVAPSAGKQLTGGDVPLPSFAAPLTPLAVDAPAWIGNEFKQKQQAVLLALWGRDRVAEADLIAQVWRDSDGDAEGNLDRTCTRVNSRLGFSVVGCDWTISELTVGGVRHRRLERLRPQNEGHI